MIKRCVIVAAGAISDLRLLSDNIRNSDFIIAADAGYAALQKCKIQPNLIIGDFDSAAVPETEVQTVIMPCIKDCTDTEAALDKAIETECSEILLLGATGGRLDHTLANLALLQKARLAGVKLQILDENHRVSLITDETLTVQNENQRYISVFAYGGKAQGVTLRGLFYPLTDYTLQPYEPIGVSNEITEREAEISVRNGSLLIVEVFEKH